MKPAKKEHSMGIKSNEDWLRALTAAGAEQEEALKDLRQKFLHTMRSFLRQSHGGKPVLDSEEARQLAEDCAQEALLKIQEKLGSFRGESQFTTWATTVAIRILLQELRRRRWKDVSLRYSHIGDHPPDWPIEDPKSQDPEKALQQDEVWQIVTRIIEEELTARQRYVLVANVFQEMPLDLIADRLGTNRDSVYKVLHDARKKLKKCLIKRGLTQEEILHIFEITR
jgi:RNA polymerase sigma-70 factor (ECF subfamily)